MKDEATNFGGPLPDATNAANLPAIVDRAAFQVELDRVRVREKAHAHTTKASATTTSWAGTCPGTPPRRPSTT